MRLIWAIAFVFAAGAALAKDVTVTFTEEELRIQQAMNELALKTAGDQAADAYVALRAKYRAAQGADKPAHGIEKITPEVGTTK